MIQRYGVFRLGQLWTVVGDDGLRLAFTSHARAVEAARAVAAARARQGQASELHLQSENGFLIGLDAPLLVGEEDEEDDDAESEWSRRSA